MLTTAWAGHGESLARELGPDVGCVIALGGDGLVNEVVNGLMARVPQDRPGPGRHPRGLRQRLRRDAGHGLLRPHGGHRNSALSNGAGRRGARQRPLLRRDALLRFGRRYRARHHGPSPEVRPRRHHALFGKCRRSAVPPLAGVFLQDGCPGGGAGMRPSSGMGRCLSGSRAGGAHLRWPLPHHTQGAPRRRAARHLLGHAGAFAHAGAGAPSARPGRQAHGQATTSISGERPPSCSTSRRSRRPRWTGSRCAARTSSSTASPTPSPSLWASGRAMKKPRRGRGLRLMKVVPSTGFEPAAPCSGGKCSIP